MKFFILLFLLISDIVFAQEEAFAVINDKDGYVNVRKGKSAQSKVLKRLNNKTIVFVYNIPMKKGIFIMIESSGYINSL